MPLPLVSAVVVIVMVASAIVPETVGLVVLAMAKGFAAAALVGASRQAGRARLPMRLLAANQVLAGIANTMLLTGNDVTSTALLAVSYAALLSALAVLVKRRGTRLDLDGILDATFVAGALLLTLWHVVLADVALGTLDPSAAVYPALTVVALWFGLRIAFDTAPPTPAIGLLAAALTTYVLGNIGWFLDGYGPLSTPLYAATSLLVGFAALHPSSATVADPGPGPTREIPSVRMVALGGAAAVAIVARSVGEDPVPAVTVTLSLVAVAVLLWRVQRALQRRRQVERQLRHRLTHDELTGLPNQSCLRDRLQELLATESGVGVVFIDIDRFRVINDVHGHRAGDQLLTMIVALLDDAVPDDVVLARWSGDVFVVAGTAADPAEARYHTAALLRRIASGPFAIDGQPIGLTASAGVVFAMAGRDAGAVLRDADTALHQAKERGPGGIVVHDATLRSHLLSQVDLENALREAVGRGELAVHYQPEVVLVDDHLYAHEALLRWHRPGRGEVLPEHFITVAEQMGLIRDIGDYVMRQACMRASRLPPPTRVAVNASHEELTDPGYPRRVEAILSKTGLAPGRLIIEITEHGLLSDPTLAMRSLERLAEFGVQIALDDFGTGYSSLAQLKRLPISILKVDRSFVSGLLTNPDDRAIITATINLATDLDLTVVAEGVETREQALELRRLGCHVAQGFLYGRPEAAPDAAQARDTESAE